MQYNTLPKHTVSFGLALAISSIANALLVIAKEKNHAVESGMQRVTGSHWITHAVVILIVFLAVGFLSAGLKGGLGLTVPVNRLIKIIVSGIIAATAVIVGFYLMAG